jgi:hypothetical protein
MAKTYDIALVDEIRRRLEATYEEAVLGLDAADGDLVRALAATEKIKAQRDSAQFSGEEIGRAMELAKEGRLRGLLVRLGGTKVGEVPLPKGPAGGALGAVFSLLLSRVTVELIADDEDEAEKAEAGDECTSKTSSSP